MFLEFSRNLTESVNIGTPVSKSIINMSRKKYGALTPYIEKLGNQISLGIPVHRAFENFARDVNNPVISRAVSLISEAERAGGEIDYILESVAQSISEIENLFQGYINKVDHTLRDKIQHRRTLFSPQMPSAPRTSKTVENTARRRQQYQQIKMLTEHHQQEIGYIKKKQLFLTLVYVKILQIGK